MIMYFSFKFNYKIKYWCFIDKTIEIFFFILVVMFSSTEMRRELRMGSELEFTQHHFLPSWLWQGV